MSKPDSPPLAAWLALALAFPIIDGTALAARKPAGAHALVGARVVVAPGRSLDKATIVLRNGLIEAVGTGVEPPADARIWDMSGLTIYAGLIDAHVALGRLNGREPTARPAQPPEEGATPPQPPPQPRAGASSPILGVVPELRATDGLAPSAKVLEELRGLGFTTACAVPDSGVVRGTTAVLNLGGGEVSEELLAADAAQTVSLEIGAERSEYPASLMGSIAVVRQLLSDARWYAEAHAAYARRPQQTERPPTDSALAALEAASRGRQRVLFEGSGPLFIDRVAAIVSEFGLDAFALGTGEEYVRIELARKAGIPLVLPVNFPEPPDIEDELEWLDVPLSELRHWDRAASNPRWVAEAGIPFALTAHGLEKAESFPARYRTAIERGLDPERALDALTRTPARLLGLAERLGSIEAGKIANLTVSHGELYAKGSRIEAVWIDGRPYEIPEPAETTASWALAVTDEARALVIELELTARGQAVKAQLKLGGAQPVEATEAARTAAGYSLSFDGSSFGLGDRVSAMLVEREGKLAGSFQLPSGRLIDVSGAPASHAAAATAAEPAPREPPRPDGGPLLAPAALLVRNATIWTSGPAGLLEVADLLVKEGRIAAVGKGLEAPRDAEVIDARGRHVTPGLIDAHSHTAIEGGANEGTLAVTAHVRIGDVIDSQDVGIYRELAGGLTTANLLHGSANPIGGQNVVIKLRWGALPQDLKLAGAPAGIKFALGENVKQSNWGDAFTTRYPQTRMGVEQVMREAFLHALESRRRQQEFEALPSRVRRDTVPPRRDLVDTALLEILDGQRLVHCHSYRQDEILMLIRLADAFKFKIATFQHVLEGYKVADEIAAHGAGASSFSDWWAYKFEVYDAIPYSGAIMWKRGVVVSFNSDSDELARRLNLEAAKAVKYGGVPPVEALKFVTINPARQLGLDELTGSLETGKAADFVIWSGSPLDTRSVALETWVDGRKYFDRDLDLAARAGRETEHQELVAKARSAAERKQPGKAGEPK